MISNVVGVGFLRGYHTTGELGKYRRGMLYWVCRSENYGSMERECLVRRYIAGVHLWGPRLLEGQRPILVSAEKNRPWWW